MTDQPSCSEIAKQCLKENCIDVERLPELVGSITEALEAKQKTIEELQHKYDLAIEEVDKLARQLDFSETTLRAYESYRIFKQDSFREVDGGAPVKEIDPVKAFEVIEDLKAEVEALKKEIGNREV